MSGEDSNSAPRGFGFGNFELFPDRQILLRDGVIVRVGSRAFEILKVLVESPGQIISKDILLSRVWPNTYVEEDNLKVNIAALRRALGDTVDAPQYVASVFGRGYRFIAPVQALDLSGPWSETSAMQPVKGGFPAVPTSIFGRADTIASILADLKTARLVTVVGEGGVGKTTVAIAAVCAAARENRVRAVFIDLATVHEEQHIPMAIAASLGLASGSSDIIADIAQAIGAQKLILLFDNCEHLMPGVAARIDQMLSLLEGLRIVATGREQLRLRSERILRLGGLKCDPRSAPTAIEARAYPAAELFATRALERAQYEIADADAPAVVEICRRLGGNPLAIELAATRTATFSPAKIMESLEGALHLLRHGPPGVPLRQQSLLATLDWSYNLLSEREASVLRTVSVFAGDFGITGASVVSGLPAEEVVDCLTQLYAKSLLAPSGASDVFRYRLLETTGSYCLERLQASGEEQIVRRRHAEYLAKVLERAAQDWNTRPAREWGATYARCIDDLRAALAWAEGRGDRSLVVRLTVAGSILWNHFSMMNESTTATARALADLPNSLIGSPSEMMLQTALAGELMFGRGPVPEAVEAARRALAIAVALGDTDFTLRSLRVVGGYETLIGHYAAALKSMEVYLSIAATEDASAMPSGETLLSIVEVHLGRLDAVHQRVAARYRPDLKRHDEPKMARFQFDANVEYGIVLGLTEWLAGFPDRASRTSATIVEQSLDIGHGATLSNALAVTACPVAIWNGRYADAERYLDLLDIHVRQNGIGIWHPLVLYFRGLLACKRDGALAEGSLLLQQAIAELRACNHRQRLSFALGSLAEAMAEQGHLAAAAQHIEEAVGLAAALGEKYYFPELLRVRGVIHALSGRLEAAESALGDALALAEAIGAKGWSLRTATSLARLWSDAGRLQAAHAVLEPALAGFTEGFDTIDLKSAKGLLAELGARLPR